MFFWERREVLITNFAEQFGIAQRALKSAGIKYVTKVVNSGSSHRRGGTFAGSIGERVDLEIVYYIYTKKEDAERAEFLIKQA